MADMVSGVVRQTAIDGINAAMAVAASGARTAPKDATKLSQHRSLERATVMQERDRPLPRDRQRPPRGVTRGD